MSNAFQHLWRSWFFKYINIKRIKRCSNVEPSLMIRMYKAHLVVFPLNIRWILIINILVVCIDFYVNGVGLWLSFILLWLLVFDISILQIPKKEFGSVFSSSRPWSSLTSVGISTYPGWGPLGNCLYLRSTPFLSPHVARGSWGFSNNFFSFLYS